MRKFSIFISSTVVLGVFFVFPFVAGAQVTGKSLGLFPCNGPDCNFGHIIALVDSIIKTIFTVILIVTPLLIARAGYYYIISSDKPAERAKANSQLRNIVIGLAIVALSYTVVKLVLTTLVDIKTPFN
ncbi:MAG: hypothetical protein ACYCZW_03200 [Minisyncoccota bacterium]